MHILSPETDNCPSWISGRERMTVENISWSISTKECCRPRRGLNPRPPGLQSDGASNWATEAGEPPWRGGSNEYSLSMFWTEIWKMSEFLSENFQFLVVKFPIYWIGVFSKCYFVKQHSFSYCLVPRWKRLIFLCVTYNICIIKVSNRIHKKVT